MYRELYFYRLLDTIFNCKAIALQLKITRSDDKSLNLMTLKTKYSYPPENGGKSAIVSLSLITIFS